MSAPGVRLEESRTIRVVIVDDHPMMRQSLRFALLTASDITVVGEAADGEEALLVCVDLHPDVVIMDLRLPGMASAQAIRTLRRQEPAPQVLVHTAEYHERLIPEALASGACGYVLKEGAIAELCAAIRAAHARQQA